MPIRIDCAACKKAFSAPDHLAGKTIKCPNCKSPIPIPAPDTNIPLGELFDEASAPAAARANPAQLKSPFDALEGLVAPETGRVLGRIPAAAQQPATKRPARHRRTEPLLPGFEENKNFAVLLCLALVALGVMFYLEITSPAHLSTLSVFGVIVYVLWGLFALFTLMAFAPGDTERFQSLYWIPALLPVLMTLVSILAAGPNASSEQPGGTLNAHQTAAATGFIVGRVLVSLLGGAIAFLLYRRFGFGRVQSFLFPLGVTFLGFGMYLARDRLEMQARNRALDDTPTPAQVSTTSPPPKAPGTEPPKPDVEVRPAAIPNPDAADSPDAESSPDVPSEPEDAVAPTPPPPQPSEPAPLAIEPQDDTQGGEPILTVNQAPSNSPVRRHPKASWYELSNPRNSSPGRLSNAIAVDYRRVSGNISGHDIVMMAKGPDGQREYRAIGISPFFNEQGSIEGSTIGGMRSHLGQEPVEVWLEERMRFGRSVLRMKVSKSVTLGNVGQLTYARGWNDEEKRAIGEWEKSNAPPASPPAGHQIATADMTLLPGMPAMAGWRGDWQRAEIIAVNKSGGVLVKYLEHPSDLVPRARSWIAVEEKTLAAGRANPGQFKPSVQVVPGGMAAVPEGLLPVEDKTPIVKGTPVRAEHHGKLADAVVIDVRPDGRLRLHWDGEPSAWDENLARSEVLIASETLEALKKPGAAEAMAERIKNAPRSPAEEAHEKFMRDFGKAGKRTERGLLDYPITISIPNNAVRVTDKTPLEKGTRLGCNWGHSWYDVTVLELNDDDTVKIHWDKFGSAWDGDIARDSLIIETKVLTKLENKAKTAAAVAKKAAAAKDDGAEKTESKGSSPVTATKFKVVLRDFGSSKIQVTKVVMEATGLGLKDAKEFVEAAPITIKQDLSKDAAEKLQSELKVAGGTADVESQ